MGKLYIEGKQYSFRSEIHGEQTASRLNRSYPAAGKDHGGDDQSPKIKSLPIVDKNRCAGMGAVALTVLRQG